jgi:hypothetical protein
MLAFAARVCMSPPKSVEICLLLVFLEPAFVVGALGYQLHCADAAVDAFLCFLAYALLG